MNPGMSIFNGENYLNDWTLQITNTGASTATLSSYALNPVTVTPSGTSVASVKAATVNAAGTNYSVGDNLNVSGGTFSNAAASLPYRLVRLLHSKKFSILIIQFEYHSHIFSNLITSTWKS